MCRASRIARSNVRRRERPKWERTTRGMRRSPAQRRRMEQDWTSWTFSPDERWNDRSKAEKPRTVQPIPRGLGRGGARHNSSFLCFLCLLLWKAASSQFSREQTKETKSVPIASFPELQRLDRSGLASIWIALILFV